MENVICLKQAFVLEVEQKHLKLVKHDIYLNGNIIVGVDKYYGSYYEYDYSNKVVIPKLFNIHSHLGESCFRDIQGNDWTISSYLDYTEKHNNSLDSVCRENEWTESAYYTLKEQYKKNIIGFCASRSAGVCESFKYCNMSGYPIMNIPKVNSYKKGGIEAFISYFNKYNNGLCSVGVFLHSIYMNDIESFILAKKCMDYGAEFITVHVSEDIVTTKMEMEKFGVTAVTLLDNYGLLTKKTILVHCCCITENDLNLIKERNATIAVCPISNHFLNTKVIDIYKLEMMGINWCISTDGLATGRTFDMLDQIQFLKKEFPLLPNYRFYENITTSPAKLFNRKVYTGKIEVETLANFITLEVTDFYSKYGRFICEG